MHPCPRRPRSSRPSPAGVSAGKLSARSAALQIAGKLPLVLRGFAPICSDGDLSAPKRNYCAWGIRQMRALLKPLVRDYKLDPTGQACPVERRP